MADIIKDAQLAIEIAQKFDTPKDKIDLAVLAIVNDLCDRRGLKHEWRQVDEDIQEEIKEVWRQILRIVFSEQ